MIYLSQVPLPGDPAGTQNGKIVSLLCKPIYFLTI